MKNNLVSKRNWIILAFFLNDYHSGQSSRGYKMLCYTLRKLQRLGVNKPLDADRKAVENSPLYKELERKYIRKV